MFSLTSYFLFLRNKNTKNTNEILLLLFLVFNSFEKIILLKMKIEI